jgi:hypothetical protein
MDLDMTTTYEGGPLWSSKWGGRGLPPSPEIEKMDDEEGWRFAANATMDPERSKEELASILRRSGIGDVLVAEETKNDWPSRIVVSFILRGRSYSINLAIPQTARKDRDEQERRRRWRVMVLLIKGIIEASRPDMMGDRALSPWCISGPRLIPALPAPKQRKVTP